MSKRALTRLLMISVVVIFSLTGLLLMRGGMMGDDGRNGDDVSDVTYRVAWRGTRHCSANLGGDRISQTKMTTLWRNWDRSPRLHLSDARLVM